MARVSRRISLKIAIPIALVALITTTGISSFETLFAPKAELIPRWTTFAAQSQQSVDQKYWNGFLGKYREENSDRIARLAYQRVSLNDQKGLQDHIESLQDIPVSTLNREEQLAYWINLYNAATVNVILEHFPVKSIRDINISPGIFASGPWDKKLLRVEGEQLSLNDIEHGILRPGWKDPRVHYVLNCASLGCPDIPSEYQIITPVCFTTKPNYLHKWQPS